MSVRSSTIARRFPCCPRIRVRLDKKILLCFCTLFFCLSPFPPPIELKIEHEKSGTTESASSSSASCGLATCLARLACARLARRRRSRRRRRVFERRRRAPNDAASPRSHHRGRRMPPGDASGKGRVQRLDASTRVFRSASRRARR